MFLQHVERFASTSKLDFGTCLEWLTQHGEQLTHAFVAEAPATLLHGDLRLDNVVFGANECAFLDWQLVRCGPAAYDVAYFLSSALHEDVTDVTPILQRYHEALGQPSYPYDALERDYQRATLMILASLSTADEVDVGDGRGAEIMQRWYQRLAARVAAIEPTQLGI